jgi:ribosome-binding protein aMBF1 (putative translation factor)
MEAKNGPESSHKDHKLEIRPAPLPVDRAIRKLGSDIALARRRRRISQASLAERIGASLSTVKRMEAGDLRVPIHFVARTLHVFGEIEKLSRLLDTSEDPIGLSLMDEQLPRRIRARKPGPERGAL